MSDFSIHCHALSGCSPTPLAHYLKALGILRLVAEQKDPAARGWWRNDVFHLATTMDREAIATFFLHGYAPTSMVAPWNGGSGFYPKDNKSGIEPIENSEADRFAPFREAIQTARRVVDHLEEKPEKGDTKNDVIAKCRLACRGGMQQWIDAALVISAEGEPSFPALLGTGGNDGRLDFTTNYMQRLVSLFDAADPAAKPFDNTIPQLDAAIWGDPTPTLESGAIGQFFPGAAGGPNGTSGFDGGVQVNPWDYVLMLEGAIIFRSGLSRKCASQHLPQAAAPFAVRASGAGYGSSDSADAGARGEQWMPLWSRPSTLGEVFGIFREGRSKIGGRLAERGTDMARSVARMGVARGISSFERYGYIERNGLANLAVPLGRFEVRRGRNQELLDEVAPWLDGLRRLASAKNSPESFDRAHRACENALIACTRSDDASGYLALLVSLAKAEDQMVQSPKFAAENFAKPLPRLSRRWLNVVEETEESAELRLASALAAQHGRLEPKEPS
ncbi:MAG: type I-U CRISPR-associated protein Csx17, partial [Planctomycetales bacterium]|nr:type I-U CRISPR-associated protein Csx17 [Planctomycetales bacterium]